MHPTVAANMPGMPATRMPTNVAELMAMGPGVISAMVTRSVNSCMVSHACRVTVSLWISGMAAYPPPMLKRPTCTKLRNSSKIFMPCALPACAPAP